jgi:hypothetical protein
MDKGPVKNELWLSSPHRKEVEGLGKRPHHRTILVLFVNNRNLSGAFSVL